MPENEKNYAYWRGYRDARVDGLMFLVENFNKVILTNSSVCPYDDSDEEAARYYAGHANGLRSFKNDLYKAIVKSDELDS